MLQSGLQLPLQFVRFVHHMQSASIITLYEPQGIRDTLFPFTETKSVADLRVGIFTIREKWSHLLQQEVQVVTDRKAVTSGIAVPANLLPAKEDYLQIIESCRTEQEVSDEIRRLQYSWQIFSFNEWAIRSDFYIRINEAKSAQWHESTQVNDPRGLFVEEGAQVLHSIINTQTGPVYIGKNALVMEGCLIRGPVSIGEGAVVKMGTKLYGGTTIGPYCVAGGEIKNSVMMSHSNKAHDGYLGDSVIGSWCNLGAGTSTSNMKNNAGAVKYPYPDATDEGPGFKGGLLMGDHSRTAINTSFNTGSIVGVGCNIFGNETPAKYVPHFTWGKERYQWEKAVRDIEQWMRLKGEKPEEKELINLQNLYHKTFDDEKTNSRG